MGVGEGVFWRARVQEPSYGGWLSECTPDAISQRRECPRTRAYPAIAFGVESVSHCTPPPITAVPPLLSCAPQSELGGPRSVVQPQERMRDWGWLPAPRGAQGTLWRCKRPFAFPILGYILCASSAASTVGMPVTRHPPCSPGRAVFPHPVPRLYSRPRCKVEPSGKHSPTWDLRNTRTHYLDAVEHVSELLPRVTPLLASPPVEPFER